MTKTEARNLGTEHGVCFANTLSNEQLLADVAGLVLKSRANEWAVTQAGFRSTETGNAPSYIDAFLNAAILRYNGRRAELPEVKAEMRRKAVEWKLESLLSGADDDLQKWAVSFAENPQYAFEWADRAIQAAARKDVALRLKSIIEAPEHGGHEAALKYAVDQALRGARWPSHSTSGVSNLAKEAVTAAYADFAADFQHRD
jgi:hypothetical protein